MELQTLRAFREELLKISAARSRMTVPQSRIGRRPMSVETMLRKEKDGTLYKAAGAMISTGSSDGAPSVVPYEDQAQIEQPAKLQKRKWEVPTIDDSPQHVDRVDGRGELLTQVGPGSSMGATGIAYTNSGY
jgi:hypothetical protein